MTKPTEGQSSAAGLAISWQVIDEVLAAARLTAYEEHCRECVKLAVRNLVETMEKKCRTE